MNLSNLLYYILNLITEGHKWQYQNATCTNTVPRTYFTALQWLALFAAFVFVVTKREGLNEDTIDLLLSSLSIMTGLFLALVVVVYGKFTELKFEAATYDEKINKVKTWNYLRQFNALTSYAILVSLVVISILICALLFGYETNLNEQCFAPSFKEIDWFLTIRNSFVVLVRFCTVYFLLDFIILTVYAVSSLFQFINVEMLSKNPPYEINKRMVASDSKTLRVQYPRLYILGYILIAMFFIGFIIYNFDALSNLL